MKLYCKSEYHNQPAGLHFDKEGVIDIDDAKAEFLLRDAPDNFARYEEFPQPQVLEGAAPPSAKDMGNTTSDPELVKLVKGESGEEDAEGDEDESDEETKSLDAPKKDKQVKAAPKKK